LMCLTDVIHRHKVNSEYSFLLMVFTLRNQDKCPLITAHFFFSCRFSGG